MTSQCAVRHGTGYGMAGLSGTVKTLICLCRHYASSTNVRGFTVVVITIVYSYDLSSIFYSL